MSPIGRVFIVLNLLLAGTFVGFSGTYLQKQHNFKEKAEKLQTQLTDATTKWDAERLRLETDRNNFENAKTAAETAKGGLETELKNTKDENDTLSRRLAAMEGAVAKINGDLASANTQAQAAFAQSQEAYKSSMTAQQAKDDAVRAKDAAEDENRNLKTTVAALEATVQTKVAEYGDLKKDRNELALLVKIAQQKGFSPALAAPALDGKVTGVAAEGRLCTINPVGSRDRDEHRGAPCHAQLQLRDLRRLGLQGRSGRSGLPQDGQRGDLPHGPERGQGLDPSR